MPKPSSFVWYELMTPDPAAAERFYREVVGWTAQDAGMGGVHGYRILHAGGVPMGGLMATPAELKGAPPFWIGYLAVDDVDAFAARVRETGGAIHRPPSDLPDVGRFAVVADPQGASFILFRPASTEGPPPAPPQTPGQIGWRELHAADGRKAYDWYASLFGWGRGEAMDMGALGVYQIFTIGGVQAGGVMTRMSAAEPPSWLFYVNVDGIDAAVARVRAAGGQVRAEPHEVPGGAWIAPCADPQGAAFALVAPRR